MSHGSPCQVNKLKPDVVFTPMQTMGGAGRRYGLVKTLHDLIYYRNRTPPRDLNPAIRLLWRLYHLAWWPQRVLLNQADEVATDLGDLEEPDRAAPAHEATALDRGATPRTRRRGVPALARSAR